MRADGVTGCGHLLENFGVIGRMLADREEHGLGAFVGKRLEHGGRGGPGTVVEGQHDFLVGQEVELLEMLKAEARAARGVDFNHAGDPERVGIGAWIWRAGRGRQAGGWCDSEAVTGTSSSGSGLCGDGRRRLGGGRRRFEGRLHRHAAGKSRTKRRR